MASAETDRRRLALLAALERRGVRAHGRSCLHAWIPVREEGFAVRHLLDAGYGLAMSSGDYGDVGVGGLATTGGIGFLARKHGLTIDHVVAAELVLADGTLVRTDAEHHPDLLWAVRGAGGNFGIVTALELEACEVRDVVFATMAFEAAPGLLEQWAGIARSSRIRRGRGDPASAADARGHASARRTRPDRLPDDRSGPPRGAVLGDVPQA